MTITVWSLTCLVMLLAAFVMSVTGFGFSLVATPLLLFFLEPKAVIVYNVFLGTITCIPILWQSRHSIRPKPVALLGIACIFGLPIGIYILSQVVSPVLKLVIAGLVVVFAALLALGYSYRFKREELGSIISGFTSGTLMTSTGLGGPPVILFLLNQGWGKENFRATIAAYFILMGLTSFAALGLSGIVSGEVLVMSLTFLPTVPVGFYLGAKVLPHMNSALFRKVAIATILLAGLVGIATGVSALL